MGGSLRPNSAWGTQITGVWAAAVHPRTPSRWRGGLGAGTCPHNPGEKCLILPAVVPSTEREGVGVCRRLSVQSRLSPVMW